MNEEKYKQIFGQDAYDSLMAFKKQLKICNK